MYHPQKPILANFSAFFLWSPLENSTTRTTIIGKASVLTADFCIRISNQHKYFTDTLCKYNIGVEQKYFFTEYNFHIINNSRACRQSWHIAQNSY